MVVFTSEYVQRLSIAVPTFVGFSVYIVIGWPDVGSRGSVGVVIAERGPVVPTRLWLSVTCRL